jgi:flavin-binding protein dodecin
MSIHKVIEVLSQSDESWEDAAQRAVADAARTVNDIRSIYIQEMTGVVEGGRIVSYRVNAKLTFEIRE